MNDKSEIVARVGFRSMPNGGYKWLKPGCRRGWWRVMVYRGEPPTRDDVRAVGFVGAIDTPSGIDGVTDKSGYYIGDNYLLCTCIADAINDGALPWVPGRPSRAWAEILDAQHAAVTEASP